MLPRTGWCRSGKDSVRYGRLLERRQDMAEPSEPLGLPENPPSEPGVNVLLVDDQPANLLALEAILEDLGHNLVRARSGEEALQRLLADEFALVLLDVQMPGLDGFETAKRIRGREASRHTPIIFLTAFESDRFPVEEAYSLGAVDYLVKPLVPVVVRGKVAGLVDLFEKTRQVKRQAERIRQMERREFEERLAQENARRRWSEGQFRELMEQAPFSVQVFAPDGHTLRVNRAWEELWGVTLDQIADYNILVDPQLEARGILPLIRRAFAGDPVEIPAIPYDPNETISNISRHPDPLRWVSAIAYPLKDDSGRIREVILVHQDITASKRAEAQLREVEARFTAILNYSPSCIFAKDRQGRYLLANKALGEFTGRDAADLLGRTDADLYPAEVAARFARDDGDLLASGSPRIYEESFPHADTIVTALTVKFPLVGADGTPYAVCGIATDISDRKRAQDALRESERRWRSLAEALPNLVWTDLPDGQCDYLSSQWATYTGIPENELLGLTWLERVIHPDDRERTAALWRAACEDKADYDLEYRIRRHDGQYHWFKTRGVPIRDERGHIVKWFGTCTDIEDQKQAHEALAQSEERFRQLADAMPQIVWTARPDGNIDYLNRQWHEFTGLPETLGNEGWAQILHPDDAAPAKERWAASVQSGALFEMEIRLLDRRRQTYRWHLIRTVAAHNGSGGVARWFGTATDIHEQKRAEESSRYLAEASAALAGVVDYESTLQKVANLAVPYFADWSTVDVANDDGTLRRLAVAHRDPEKTPLAHELMHHHSPDPQAKGGIGAVFRTGQPEIVEEITDELLVRGAKDERHLSLIRLLGLKSYVCVPLIVSGNPFGVLTFATAESGRRYTEADLALAKDLAHQAAVAIENTQLYQALREADRRKDEFLATLAHELRNPLAPIRNSLQILKMPRVDAQTVERSRDMMERQVHHLVRLVDDLLDVSRVMRGKIELRRERVELATVVARAVETVQPLIEAQGHRFDISLPSESLPIDADPVRLAQVVGNLLTNAAKYTEPGGRIWLTAERDGDMAALRVRDNGIGIAPHMLPRIFELFVQVDHASTKAQGGLGIGLTLVKNLVEMHNGIVQAQSEGLGKGCEFVVRLPLVVQAIDQNHSPEAGRQADQHAPPSGKRLLVVDDNQDAADSLAMLLRLQGHDVRVAYSGMAALEMTKAYTPDVVFMDIGMPGMDGYEAARRIRQQPGLGNVVLAALTGWGQQEDRRRTAEVGFDHHLVKPVEPNALEKLLAGLQTKTA
jgi:PAS domain S-box-containing protein